MENNRKKTETNSPHGVVPTAHYFRQPPEQSWRPRCEQIRWRRTDEEVEVEVGRASWPKKIRRWDPGLVPSAHYFWQPPEQSWRPRWEQIRWRRAEEDVEVENGLEMK